MITNLAQAISGFPAGEPQSTDTVTQPVSLLNELIEELQDLRAAVKVLQETQDQAYETLNSSAVKILKAIIAGIDIVLGEDYS